MAHSAEALGQKSSTYQGCLRRLVMRCHGSRRQTKRDRSSDSVNAPGFIYDRKGQVSSRRVGISGASDLLYRHPVHRPRNCRCCRPFIVVDVLETQDELGLSLCGSALNLSPSQPADRASTNHSLCIAVAAHLVLYNFTLKTSPPSAFDPRAKGPALKKLTISPGESTVGWERGVVYAKAQNLARTLMELPANLMTPTAFTERAKEELKGLTNVEVIVRDEAGHYKGAPNADALPVAFVGKGITFDSGGISIKPGAHIKLMRGDMSGAAAVVSSMLAIAQFKLSTSCSLITSCRAFSHI
ncbi:hypothetical protein BU15DRAFT_76303 [Melanogaster broomeanus]|nr:hypothetical protein BU15DRAFT_76303 [Melanogaster broomeanus]